MVAAVFGAADAAGRDLHSFSFAVVRANKSFHVARTIAQPIARDVVLRDIGGIDGRGGERGVQEADRADQGLVLDVEGEDGGGEAGPGFVVEVFGAVGEDCG